MFGFLKDKLKKAVQKFSRNAEDSVTEEKVEDKKAIEEAKKAEAKIVKAAKPKKPVPKAPAPAKEEQEEKKTERATPKKAREPAPKKSPESSKEAPKKPEEPLVLEEEQPDLQKTSEERDVLVEKPAPPPKESKAVLEEKTAASKAEKTEAPPPKGFLKKLFGKKTPPDKEKAEKPETAPEKSPATEEAIPQESRPLKPVPAEEPEPVEPFKQGAAEEAPVPEKREETPKEGFFGKLKDSFTKKQLSSEKFDELFWELELAMLENNVAVEVIEKIKQDLKDELTSGKVSRLGVEDMIVARLRQSIDELFTAEPFDLLEKIRKGGRPFKLCIIGVNGSGKTTTLAKLVHLLQREKLSAVVAASDTFRAAAIDQLKEHTDRLGVKLVSQGYGADPAAVAFDAIKHAEANSVDVVLIDTAGRLHSNTNLMQELEKVVRVAKPDLKLFVGESITGNDCVEQAKVFDSLVGIDGIILSKADVDEKGGAAISVSYVTGKPILYLGTGQTYDDLEVFDKDKIVSAVGL